MPPVDTEEATGSAPNEPGRASLRPRSRRGEGGRLRAEIIAAASQLLAETGDVGKVSLRAVARRVGVATTSIYLHFRSIDDLALAVKIDCFEELGRCLAAVTAEHTAPPDRLRAWAHEYVRYGLANRGRFWIIFTSQNLSAAMVSDAVQVGMPVFETLCDEVGQVTTADADTDATMIALHLWTALHGIVTLRTARPAFPWPDLADEIDSLIARLIGEPR